MYNVELQTTAPVELAPMCTSFLENYILFL